MVFDLRWLSRVFNASRLRRRFPQSVIHPGAMADQSCALGCNSVLFRDVVLTSSTIGAYSYVQACSVISNAEIGPFCSIAGEVTVGLGEHPTFMVSTSPTFYDNEQPLPKFFARKQVFAASLPRTVIGADVWIGQRAMVKAGVNIGVGAVIGASSMVTKDIPPYTIAAGNPCRPIRLRFPELVCQELLESQWWTFSDQVLAGLAIAFSDPAKFLLAVKMFQESTARSEANGTLIS